MSQSTPQKIELLGSDGHRMTAWRANPSGSPKGGVVVLHAVYGLTDHIGDICASWASAGYCAIAPALFDRQARDVTHPYSQQGASAGSQCYAALKTHEVFADINTCAAAVGGAESVVISGFCSGGTWAWKAAAACKFAAQVNFYGSHIFAPDTIDLAPLCPTILHYGDSDHVVLKQNVERIADRHPQIAMRIYEGAGHAFMNPAQAGFNEAAAARAWASSLAFLDHHLGASSP